MLCTRTESEAIPMSIPKLQDILQAQKRIRPYLARTPLHSYPAIKELVGTTLFIKHENYQPVAAFKVRARFNLISHLRAEARTRGFIPTPPPIHRHPVPYPPPLSGLKPAISLPTHPTP